MRKPLCVKCQTQFRSIESGVTVVTMDGCNQPYELIKADLLECPGCKTQVVACYANQPYSRHHDPDFSKRLAQAKHHLVYDFERSHLTT